MEETNGDRRYSFRLTQDDEKLGELLKSIPNSKRSVVIRQMLNFAYRMLLEEQKEKKNFEEMKLEVQKLQKIHEQNHAEILAELKKGVVVTTLPNQPEDKKDLSKEAMDETTNSFLSSFGYEMG